MINTDEKFRTCRNCPRLTHNGPEPGYFYDKIGKYTVSIECECHKKWSKDRELYNKLESSNLLTNPVNITFESYRGNKSIINKKKIEYLSENPDITLSGISIFLYGDNNCQKSTLAKLLGQKMILKGHTAFFTSMKEMINNLKDDFNISDDEDFRKKQYLKTISETDLLIIDESFDREKCRVAGTGYEISFLDNFLRNRIERYHKSICFISNHRVDEIMAQGFSKSLESLIDRNTEETKLLFQDDYTKCSPNTKNIFANFDAGEEE